MYFYQKYVGRFPDENAHISYIAYLEKESSIIPNFKDMKLLAQPSNNSNNENITSYTFGDDFNYLGHPPLYYQILRISGAVQIKDNIVTVNINKLRLFSAILSALGILLILYIGYTRIGKNPLLHFLYAAIVVSVPMLAYDCAGINNDTLALIGLSIFIFGLLRFSEQKRNFATYLFISLGVFISFMSKLTTGLVVSIAILIYLILIFIKERNIKFLFSKKFIFTLPIYLVTASYYVLIYFQTGSIQPTYRLLDPEGFYKSVFYVNVVNRTHMNLIQYIFYFIKGFLFTWTCIVSHVALPKNGGLISLNTTALIILLFLPILLVFKIKKRTQDSSIVLALISVYFALVISAIIQFSHAFNEYINVSGYLGGFQSRYYLCGISAIALAVIFVIKDFFDEIPVVKTKYQSKSKLKAYQTKSPFNLKNMFLYCICILFICLLFYEDFIYFLIYFKDYL